MTSSDEIARISRRAYNTRQMEDRIPSLTSSASNTLHSSRIEELVDKASIRSGFRFERKDDIN